MRRGSGDAEGDEDAGAAATASRRKRKRLPGEDANLRFDEMEAYLQVCGVVTLLQVASGWRSVQFAHDRHGCCVAAKHRGVADQGDDTRAWLELYPLLMGISACCDNLMHAACAGR